MASIHHRAALFAALGDPIRLEIAEELSRSDRTPGELVEKFEMSSALLAHHLDVLESAGLIERTESHADRRKRFVRLVERHRPLLIGAPAATSVVFVCRQNSARSQLAAAIWQRIVGTTATSAGTAPATAVHHLPCKLPGSTSLTCAAQSRFNTSLATVEARRSLPSATSRMMT